MGRIRFFCGYAPARLPAHRDCAAHNSPPAQSNPSCQALHVVGGEPLPSAFVTFARYQILTVLAAGLQALRALQQRSKSSPKAAAPSSSPAAASSSGGGGGAGLWVAACELGTYTVLGSLLSVWGIGRLPSVTSEILGSTIHVFVPLLSLGLLGRANAAFGLNTWLGCLLAFAAAIISTVADGASISGESTGGVDALGSVAVLLATMVYALQRVRTQVHLRSHESEALNTSRMVCMGFLSAVPLFFDVAAGGASRATVLRIRHVTSVQWGLLFLSVFSSAFIASSMLVRTYDSMSPQHHLPSFPRLLTHSPPRTAYHRASQFSALRVISAANAQPFSALQPVFAAVGSLHLRTFLPAACQPTLRPPILAACAACVRAGLVDAVAVGACHSRRDGGRSHDDWGDPPRVHRQDVGKEARLTVVIGVACRECRISISGRTAVLR